MLSRNSITYVNISNSMRAAGEQIKHSSSMSNQYPLRVPLFLSRFWTIPAVLYLFALFFIISFCGCISQTSSFSNHYFPVNNSNKRESSLGFSITPPAGAGWFEKLNNDSLYYLKKITPKDYSIYTKATEIHIPETDASMDRFLQFVKSVKQLNSASSDYRNISTNYAVDSELSPLCVRYSQNFEDHGDKNLRRDDFIRTRKIGLMCMHPDALVNGVDMFYVESYLQSSASGNPSNRAEGEAFLSSLKFTQTDNTKG